MENNQSTYRIRTKLGETEPINIPISLMQEYNSFEILSLKLNMDDTYRSYTSTEGIVIGRVSTANNGLGIPNVRVSIFVPKGEYSQTDEEEVLYPFSSPTDKDGDQVRYNLLPSESDVSCYQVIGTFPTKRKILDNETVCDVFEKYYKYTTVTNEAGDFMLTNIPVGKHKIHIDADLSDIGPFLSQKPYDMIENLGFEKNRFDSTRQFKTSKDLDSLAQVISQTKSVYVYPYWGDMTEYESDMKITRTDLSLNYEFKTNAIFIGSVITDKQSNAIRHNCTPTESAGKMSDMVTGPGRIEMIRKTVDDKIEQYRIKGDMLINDNGVWCYMIPMNLDYVRTDEFGNIIPTDDPNKGVPTRARVRFRITLNQMESDEDAYKRCSYLVPNNPKSYDTKFLKENDADYSFGSDTWNESFVDLFWNKVYTVKNYVPRLQKTTRPTNRKHTGIKMVNHYGDNNPFPYNDISIKLTFLYRLICVIVKIFIYLVYFLNVMISVLGALPCWLANLKLPLGLGRPFRYVMKFVPTCIALSAEFCDDGINKNVTYPGCTGCIWDESLSKCNSEQYEASKRGEQQAVCTRDSNQLENCVENQLAQQNEVTSFNFSNDWINGCLYMPLWYRHIRPKKSFLFGLFTRSARDQWCASENTFDRLKIMTYCSNKNNNSVKSTDYKGESATYKIMNGDAGCDDDCHEYRHWVGMNNGVIVNKTNTYGQKVWYYKAAEITATKNGYPEEYTNSNGVSMVSKLLYATDIVLLGSMNDCDLNGIPKFFNYLKASSFNLPTDILFSDTEISYSFDESGNLINQDAYQTSVASGCDWGNENEYGYDDGGLFYGIGCNSSEVRPTSCVNLRRICELGVGLDEMQYIENLNVSINSENDNLDLNNTDYQLRPDGFVSYDDIIDFNYRSMFATMNGNKLRTKINTETGVREYDFRYLYIDNFDGSLFVKMSQRQQNEGNANYKNNYNLESTCLDYLTFRMGDKPYYYDGDGYGDSSLPKYENSFYFYFGLKEGKTAIDLFNENYNGVCATKTDEKESIDYDKQSNSWCCVDSDNDYKHSAYDGFLTLNLENISLPCSIILNSNDNSSVSYTVVKAGGKDTTVTDEKICFYGNGATDIDKSIQGCVRYYFIYENSSPDVNQNQCQMLNNGSYNMYITDGDGNQHSFTLSLNGKYLEFDDVETPFKQPNNILTKYYKTVGGKYASSSYNSAAQSPISDSITVAVGNDGVPTVERVDKEMKNIVSADVIQGNGLKLNGTICIYGLYCDNVKLDSYIIEVEPYDKDNEDNYTDEDFWKSASEKNKTWYSPKMCCLNGIMSTSATVTNKYGKLYVTKGTSNYFNVISAAPTDSSGNPIEERRDNYIVIKAPKGGVNYRVRVTQLCKDGGGYFKSNNYVEKKLTVSEATPYKLYINDVDYDIIKKFKTGYVLKTDDGLQNGEELKPFKDFGTSSENSNFGNIKGWLQISDMFNAYYDWEVDIDKYGKNITADKKSQLTDEQIKNRKEFISKMKSAFWIQCADSEKTISYSVSTDDTPYDLWTVYNEEMVCEADDDYNETKSDADNNNRNGWQCKGESAVNISGIKIPTITSYDSTNFGISNDSVRQGQTATYASDKSACFAQDNIAEKSDGGSVSIKPPYLVACVNREGITIPSNLKKGEFFGEVENSYVGTAYEFGEVDNNKQKIRSGEYEFFGFHLIDKIFAPNIVCWSYINNIPYYVPWVEYNAESTDDSGEENGNKLGYSIKMEGILSGVINNGISNSVDEDGFVNDFKETNIFSKEVSIKTFKGDDDDSIPTRRCILFDKTNGSTDLKYQNYRFTTDVIDKNGNVIGNQFRYVLNSKGSLSFMDNGGECEAKTDLYGSMKVKILSTTLNQVFSKSSIFDYLFDRGTVEGSDTSLTLRVNCSNGDTEKPITYYIFRASHKQVKTESGFNDKVSWYPLNAVKCTVKDGNVNYWLDCNCTGTDSSVWRWDGSTTKAAYLFNKNTVESIFKDKNNDSGASLVDNDVKSGVEYTNENGETEVRETRGYGQTGVFTNLKHLPYFVVAVTENNCRAISPVYDFHTVYYIAGLLEIGDTKVLRTALVYVLAAHGSDPSSADNNEGYGYASSLKNGYSKYPRNYYLTQYDFTISYSFANGNTIVTNDGVTFTKESNRFVSSKDELNDDSSIGMSYAEPKEGSTEGEYVLYTNTGGSITVSERTTEAITGTVITPNMEYYYEVKEDATTIKYQIVQFDSNGNMNEVDLSETVPSDATKIEASTNYYVTYTEEEESETGEKTTVTYYVGIKYSTISEETIDYNPMIPYFMRYTDKPLTNDEYNTLKPLFLTKSTLQGKDKFYVTDVTGLKHKCVLHDICNTETKWKTYLTVPS